MEDIVQATLTEPGPMTLRNSNPAVDTQSGGKRFCASVLKDDIMRDAEAFTIRAKDAPASTEAV